MRTLLYAPRLPGNMSWRCGRGHGRCHFAVRSRGGMIPCRWKPWAWDNRKPRCATSPICLNAGRPSPGAWATNCKASNAASWKRRTWWWGTRPTRATKTKPAKRPTASKVRCIFFLAGDRLWEVPVVCVSSTTQAGMEEFSAHVQRCFERLNENNHLPYRRQQQDKKRFREMVTHIGLKAIFTKSQSGSLHPTGRARHRGRKQTGFTAALQFERLLTDNP